MTQPLKPKQMSAAQLMAADTDTDTDEALFSKKPLNFLMSI
jgi:hypothetical protein